jgi:hypothetical protein
VKDWKIRLEKANSWGRWNGESERLSKKTVERLNTNRESERLNKKTGESKKHEEGEIERWRGRLEKGKGWGRKLEKVKDWIRILQKVKDWRRMEKVKDWRRRLEKVKGWYSGRD